MGSFCGDLCQQHGNRKTQQQTHQGDAGTDAECAHRDVDIDAYVLWAKNKRDSKI